MQGSPLSVREYIQRGPEAAAAEKEEKRTLVCGKCIRSQCS